MTGSSISQVMRDVIVIPLVCILMNAAAVAEPVLYTEDFENGQIVNFAGNAPTITQAHRRQGNFAMKSVLDRQSSPISYRTEISTKQHVEILPGHEYWYGFSIFLPSDYVADPIWETVANWHSTPDPEEADGALEAPVSLWSNNGVWTVKIKWDSRATTVKPYYEGSVNYDLGAYRTGQWTDWVFHIKWSPYRDGFIEVWKNGEKLIDRAGPVGYNDTSGPYFKMGIYKGWRDRIEPAGVVTERTLYHDELRIADATGSYADVAPSGLARPAPPTDLSIMTAH